jgi:hypothetical protein
MLHVSKDFPCAALAMRQLMKRRDSLPLAPTPFPWAVFVAAATTTLLLLFFFCFYYYYYYRNGLMPRAGRLGAQQGTRRFGTHVHRIPPAALPADPAPSAAALTVRLRTMTHVQHAGSVCACNCLLYLSRASKSFCRADRVALSSATVRSSWAFCPAASAGLPSPAAASTAALAAAAAARAVAADTSAAASALTRAISACRAMQRH